MKLYTFHGHLKIPTSHRLCTFSRIRIVYLQCHCGFDASGLAAECRGVIWAYEGMYVCHIEVLLTPWQLHAERQYPYPQCALLQNMYITTRFSKYP